MKNLRSKKFYFQTLFILLIVSVVWLAIPVFSYGNGHDDEHPFEGINNPTVETAEEVTSLLLIITNLVAKILTLISGLVDFAIKLGNNVFDLAAVKIGWQVALSFANLGFVLAIIVIAFATILRFENYAMKKILWKLIVAALLVNFSMVIAGAFLSVSNTVSKAMIDSALGEDGVNLSNALANAVNPQAFGEVKGKGSDWGIRNIINNFFKYIAGMVFIIIFSLFIIMTFAALFIMLLVRAMVLVFLLILSPLAWLAWILPSTEKHWKTWWEEFIRWNIFAPAVFFFIYLAIATANCINPNQTCSITGGKGVALSSITEAKKKTESAAYVIDKAIIVGGETGTSADSTKEAVGIFEHIANLFIILGLLLGGLYTANKMSMIGAKQSIGALQGMGKWAGGKTWGGVKRGTGGLYNRAVDKLKLKDKSIEASKEADKSGGLGKFWHGLKARTFANLSAPSEKAVGKYESEVSKLTMTQAKAQHSTAVGAKWVALNEFLNKNQDKMPKMMEPRKVPVYEDIMEDEMMESDVLDAHGKKTMVPTGRKIKVGQKQIGEKEENVDIKNEWFAANVNGRKAEKIYERYGADFSGVEKKNGMSANAADAYIAKDLLKFENAMNKFIVKLKKSNAMDTGKAWKSIFANPYGDNKMFAQVIAKSIAKNNSQITASLLPHLGGANVVNNFSNIYKQELKGSELERFEKTIFNNYKNFEGGAPSNAATETPKS